MGQPVVIVLIMGVATGCFGGLMRDVVCNEVPMVLKQGELYLTAAFAGSAAAAVVAAPLVGSGYALAICAAVTFALRAGSLAFGWKLPVYRSRPPRAWGVSGFDGNNSIGKPVRAKREAAISATS